MRYLGWLLPVGGFAWLSLVAFSHHSMTRAVIVNHYKTLPKDVPGGYNREDMMRAMREPANEVLYRSPSTMLPGIAMLAGGLVLARVSRPAPRE